MQSQPNSPISSITRFTTTDFPDRLACIVWFTGCNMRCSYCYNPHIVTGEGNLSEIDLFNFLRTRQGKLDAVVLSGGECTLYDHLPELCESIKAMGFDIKLDTNGLNPSMIKHLVDEMLVDYIALDYKAPQSHFKALTKSTRFELFQETLEYLIHADVSFEIRTTVHPDLLDVTAINAIIGDLKNKGYAGTYYLQHYLHVDETLGNSPLPSQDFDLAALEKKIPIELRNFNF